MIKTMNKGDFVTWENEHDYDLRYTRMCALIKFDDIPAAGTNIYDTIGRVMSELAGDNDIIDIRVHWYNDNECIIITGYTDGYNAFVIDGCLYIH